MKPFFIVLISLFVLLSCNNEKNDIPYRQKSTGNINSLLVIISNDLWNDNVGEEIRKYFTAPTDGLPQDEPLFSINQIPPANFSGFAKSKRMFLNVSIGEEDKTYITRDTFARPQTGVIVISKTEKGLIDLIAKNQKIIIEEFHKSEIKERQRRTSLSLLKLDSLKQQFGVSLKIPSAYRIAKKTKDFYWIRKDLKSGSTNILIYEVPLTTITNDSLAMGEIIKMRDSISGEYIPVEEGGRFITEEAYTPFLFIAEIDGLFAYETKGIWEVKGEFMAGPFLNYAVKDTVNHRFLILEGFTFAPSVKKRNLQFELESILKSARIN